MRSPLALVALGVLAVTSPAGASPLPAAIEVEWEAPADCPTQSVFESELAAQLPKDAGRMRETLAVVVQIRKHRKLGYELRISTPVGKRAPLTDTDCSVLVKTAALIVGMAIDVSAHQERDPAPMQLYDRESPYGGLAPEDESPPVVTDDTPINVVRELPPIYLAIRATLGGDLGVLPHPAPAVGIAMAVIRDRFRIELTGATSQSQPAATVEDPTIGANLGLWTVGIRGCHEVVERSLTGSLCAGGEVGRFVVDAFGSVGPPENFLSDAPWWALTGSVVIEKRILGPFSARIETGLVLRPIQRPEFTFDILDREMDAPIHLVPVVSARVMSGIEVRFR